MWQMSRQGHRKKWKDGREVRIDDINQKGGPRYHEVSIKSGAITQGIPGDAIAKSSSEVLSVFLAT